MKSESGSSLRIASQPFSISPQLSYMESWNFSTRQFFSTNDISDISDKCEVLKMK